MPQPNGLIFVVDDDEDIREMLRLVLEGEGYQVTVAADGLEAWEQLLAGSRPALILLDFMMPRMDGEQFLKKLRASKFADLNVVIMSGNQATSRKARELNADCCLMKPVEFEDLLKTVGHFAPLHLRRDVA